MDKPIRNIACKVWISDLHNASFEKGGLVVWGEIVSRVNILGSVVSRYDKEKTYSSLTLDDSSAGIRIKTWNEDVSLLDGVFLGDVVNIIGKVRQSSNGEIFLAPEIIKKVDINWELARKMELVKEYGVNKPKEVFVPKENIVVEEKIVEEKVGLVQIGSVRQRILKCVQSEGKTFDIIKNELDFNEDEIDSALQELINDGELYEVKGVYKLLG